MATTKNITMKQFNGRDYDTLYPKTIASQIPDVYSKTDTITATTLSQLGLSANKLPNDAFQQIKTLINNAQSSADSKARIQMGTYVGTGTYGANNPCSLTFDFVPSLVLVFSPYWSTYNPFSSLKFCLLGKSVGISQLDYIRTGTSSGNKSYYVKYNMSLSNDRKTLKWWREVWYNNALYSDQAMSFINYDSDSFCNYSGATYFYIAF